MCGNLILKPATEKKFSKNHAILLQSQIKFDNFIKNIFQFNQNI